MRMQELMKRRVESVSAETTAESAREKMRARRIRHLVVTEGSKVVGVLSERDLGARTSSSVVGDIMTAPAVTAVATTTVREAANLLRGRTIGCLPILEEGKLVGIVTTTDLLELLGKGAMRPSPVGRRPNLRDRGPRRKPVSLR
jgi:acetoin utilization protein AcuB